MFDVQFFIDPFNSLLQKEDLLSLIRILWRSYMHNMFIFKNLRTFNSVADARVLTSIHMKNSRSHFDHDPLPHIDWERSQQVDTPLSE